MISNFDPISIQDNQALLDLAKDCIDRGERHFKRFRSNADRNERWYHGEQWELNATNPEWIEWREADGTTTNRIVRYTRNYIRNIVLTHKARILEDSPDAKAWPVEPNPDYIAAANITNKLIRYVFEKERMEQKWDSGVKLADLHATSAFKVCYHPDIDDITIKLHTIWDFLVDPSATNETEAEWCAFREHINPWKAKTIYVNNSLPGDPPVSEEKINDLEARPGVVVWELWHKPSDRIPGGVYLKMIDEHIFDVQPFPYMFLDLADTKNGQRHAELPIALVRNDDLRGSILGDTFVNDVIVEQRMLNEIQSQKTELRRKTSTVKIGVKNAAQAKAYARARNSVVVVPGGMDGIAQFPVPQVNPLLFSDQEDHEKHIYEQAGLNEQLVGATSPKSGTPTSQLELLRKLDSMKHRGTAISVMNAVERIANLVAWEAQAFFILPKMMRITNDAGGIDTATFNSASINGITIKIEVASEASMLKGSVADQAMGEAQAGLIQPQQAVEAMETGSVTSPLETFTRSLVGAQAQYVAKGATPQVDPNLDPQVAVDELTRIIEVQRQMGASDSQVIAVQHLLDLYRQAVQQAQQPPPQASAVPQQNPQPAAPPQAQPQQPGV